MNSNKFNIFNNIINNNNIINENNNLQLEWTTCTKSNKKKIFQ